MPSSQDKAGRYHRIITALMLIVAVIHLVPISGFSSVESLAALYQVDIADNNLAILMRHRAVLFGMLGSFIAYAAFKPAFQPVAFVGALISVATFFFLAFSVGDFNSAMRRIVVGDIVAAVALSGAIVLYVLARKR